ncbi:MAG: hypothetical protein M1826_001978 [Phylliscum demangeonii]|nr:MAG: hypothetical protein M1826_001978 [Phylliscum demangeonii]
MTIFRSLRHNSLSASATAWLQQMLQSLDAKDLSTYLSFMAPSIRMTFNNGNPSTSTSTNMPTPTFDGIDAVRAGLAQYWQSFTSIEHEALNVYGDDRHFVHEALNHYLTLDGRRLTLRAAAFIDRDEAGRVLELRLYADQTPLWSAA